MAKLLSERDVVSARLLTLEISEDELALYVAALNYLLENASDELVDEVAGAYPDEVMAIRDDLNDLLDLDMLKNRDEQLIQEPL
ncbi:MAG: hypothetical protein R3C14_02075 [Caldilineaceae bacterium]